eukprot:4066692-Amphidinium_carterae.1
MAHRNISLDLMRCWVGMMGLRCMLTFVEGIDKAAWTLIWGGVTLVSLSSDESRWPVLLSCLFSLALLAGLIRTILLAR